METTEPLPESAEKQVHCLNCKAILNDRFCAHCGQDSREFKRSVWAISFQFFETFTDFDNKLWSSLGPLIYRPGYLTKQFLLGKRKSYLNPIQMYAFFSFIFFLTVFYLPDFNQTGPSKSLSQLFEDSLYHGEDSRKDSAVHISLGGNNTLNIRKNDDNQLEWADTYKTVKGYDSVQHALPEAKRDGFFMRRFIRKGLAITEKINRKEKNVFSNLIEAFQGNIPNVVIFLLPFFALILRLLYVRRKFYYVEHLIFAIHLHCFAFLLLSIETLISRTVPNGDEAESWFYLALLLYIILAVKHMYQQGWIKTVVKCYCIAVSYSVVVALALILNLAISALVAEV